MDVIMESGSFTNDDETTYNEKETVDTSSSTGSGDSDASSTRSDDLNNPLAETGYSDTSSTDDNSVDESENE